MIILLPPRSNSGSTELGVPNQNQANKEEEKTSNIKKSLDVIET